jgi:lipoprotein-anchoring transpeptidase ErfK/SrfK
LRPRRSGAPLLAAALAFAVGGGASAAAGTSAPAAAPPASAAIPAPSRGSGAETARVVAPTAVLSAPVGGRIVTHLRAETDWSHEPQVLLVLGAVTVEGREWLRVLLPVRPSGTAGWIPASRAVLRPDRFWLELHKSSRRLLVFRAGRLVGRFPVVIGTAATPTPAGLAAIYERNRQPDPQGFLGPWALPLTALSPTLRSFGGGPGRIAIHGRDGESLLDPLGSAASHGCIRIPDAAIRWLASHVPLGTPVRIFG